jgi:cytochrome c5
LSVIMLVVTALVIVGVMEAVSSLIGSADKAQGGDAALLERIKPVGRLNTGAPLVAGGGASVAAAASGAPPAVGAAPTKTAARSGEQVYKATCQACHGTGAAGAPKLGDKAAWALRIKQGTDVLVSHAVQGFTGKTGVMPPRGTCGNCSDPELKSAVEYMIAKSR